MYWQHVVDIAFPDLLDFRCILKCITQGQVQLNYLSFLNPWCFILHSATYGVLRALCVAKLSVDLQICDHRTPCPTGQSTTACFVSRCMLRVVRFCLSGFSWQFSENIFSFRATIWHPLTNKRDHIAEFTVALAENVAAAVVALVRDAFAIVCGGVSKSLCGSACSSVCNSVGSSVFRKRLHQRL